MRAADAIAPVGAAVSFLTRVPVGRAARFDGAAVARGAAVFPLVGAAVGATAGAVADVLAGPLPALAAGGIALALLAVLTGAMHLDALADTADGLGGWTKEQRLAIMRDHAVGSYGAVAVALVVVVEASLVAALADAGNAWHALAAAGACSRAAPLPLAAVLAHARAEGQGQALAAAGRAAVAIALLLAVAVATLASGVAGAAAFATALAVAAVLGVFFRSWIGGVTGDTLGATTELTQVAALVVLVVAA